MGDRGSIGVSIRAGARSEHAREEPMTPTATEAATDQTRSAIPVIDFGPYLAGEAGAREAAAARVRARAGERRVFHPHQPRRAAAADRPDIRRGQAFSRPATRGQDGHPNERAQQRLHVDGAVRGVDLGRQRQRQAGPQRGVLHQARARPRRPAAALRTPLRRPESLARRAPRVSRQRAGLHQRHGRALRAGASRLRAGARAVRPTPSTGRSPKASSPFASRTTRP